MKRYLQHFTTNLRAHFSLMLATNLVLLACFFSVASMSLFSKNMQKVLSLWGESLQMNVYLNDQASDAEITTLLEKIRQDERVAKSEFIDRESARKQFQEQMANSAPDLIADARLMEFIPRSLQLQLNSIFTQKADSGLLEKLAQELRETPQVESVSYGQDWVQTYSSVVTGARSLGFGIMLLILVAATFIIANSISSSLEQRHTEIEVLELVGASKLMIRGPYLFEGAILGAVCGALAVVGLSCLFSYLQSSLSKILFFSNLASKLSFFTQSECLFFILITSLVGLISAALALRRLNTGWAASGN